jgi:hypothetical protein
MSMSEHFYFQTEELTATQVLSRVKNAKEYTVDVVSIGHAVDVVSIGHAVDVVSIGHAVDVVSIGHAVDVVSIGHAVDVSIGHRVDVSIGHAVDVVSIGHAFSKDTIVLRTIRNYLMEVGIRTYIYLFHSLRVIYFFLKYF